MADPYRPRAGYAVAIFGSCSAVQLARLLTTVTHLRATGTQFPIVAMVARSCATDSTLRAELASESLDVAVVEPIERARCSGKKKPKADRRAQYYEQLFTKLHLWNRTECASPREPSPSPPRSGIPHLVYMLMYQDLAWGRSSHGRSKS